MKCLMPGEIRAFQIRDNFGSHTFRCDETNEASPSILAFVKGRGNNENHYSTRSQSYVLRLVILVFLGLTFDFKC